MKQNSKQWPYLLSEDKRLKIFQSLVVQSLSNLSIKKDGRASSHKDKKIATRTKNRDKRLNKSEIPTSRTSNSHSNLGQEQDKEIATRQNPCPRANYALWTMKSQKSIFQIPASLRWSCPNWKTNLTEECKQQQIFNQPHYNRLQDWLYCINCQWEIETFSSTQIQ